MAYLTFDQIANLATFRQFYFLAWRLMGVNIALISPDLKRTLALGANESWSPFCIKLRQLGGEKHCLECDQKYLALVREQRHPLRYHCWAGLREFIVPIILDGEILAFIQCGQVLDVPPEEEEWFNTRRKLMSYGIENLPSEELFLSLRNISPQIQEDLIAMLELFGNYIAYARHQILMAEASQQSRTVERALSFVKNNYTEAISLEDVAEAAYTSKRNLTRLFQKKTGMTVLAYIQETRIANACRLLQTEKMTCIQVAFECGFGSIQQFNRVFEKLQKCTPLAFQRRCLAEKNSSIGS